MNLINDLNIKALFFCFTLVSFCTLSQPDKLFNENDLLQLTLSGDIDGLLRDRTGEPQYHSITLSYKNPDSSTVSIPIKAKTRGNFRRQKANCIYPPVLLNFSKDDTKNTLFQKQDKLKLVMPCRGDSYVVNEYLVYKLYNLVTPKSLKARLVRIVMNDPELKSRDKEPFYAILIEDEDAMAKRNDMVSIERQLVRPEQTQTEDFLNMAVFEYMIGNTDWSVQYRQNVKLIGVDTLSRPHTVPYDFDHAGIVGAPYAKPAEALQMSSIRQRRYRGFCISDMMHYQSVIKHFNTLKESFYAVYNENQWIDDRYKKSTINYLDDFFETINNPKKVKEEFQYPCRDDGTGNVVIKGMQKN